MSRQSDTYIDGSAWTVTRFGSWPIQKPVAKQLLDFRVARLGMSPPEILTHQVKPVSNRSSVARNASATEDVVEAMSEL